MNLLEINAVKLLEVLKSDPEKGLTSEQVEKNRAEFSSPRQKKGAWYTVKEIFGDVVPLIFVVLSVLSMYYKKDMGGVFSLLLFFGFYLTFKIVVNRYNAKVTDLINSKQSRSRVIRDGKICEVDSSELVQGDIMLVGFGDVVPCDALIINQSTLRVSEVQLTGNSSPVLKLTQEDVIRGKGVPYYECILFAGSVVMSGSARAIVCNTGKDVFDKRNKLTTRSKHARRTKVFEIASFISKNVSLLWLLISAVLFVWGVATGKDVFDVFYLSVSLALVSFPDLVLTLFDLTLSVGSKRLYKKGCIIRDMTAIDRMCDINCIVVDNSRYFRNSSPKPNTVYVNDERKKFRSATDPDVREIFELALTASVSGDGGMNYNGVSVEKSLQRAGEELGITPAVLNEKYLILEKMPYDAPMQMSRAIYFKDGEFYTVSLGSPWAVLKTCIKASKDGEDRILFEREKRALRDLAHSIAEGNEGVVAVAVKKIEYKEGAGQLFSDKGFTFKGYIGLHTSINADAARAVNAVSKSGIDVVLMSNEAKFTSIGFAKSLSIMKDGDMEIAAKDFAEVDEGLFRTEIKKYKVYLSLGSADKVKVVSWRKQDGDIIASAVSSVDDLQLLLESDVSFSSAVMGDNAAIQNSDVVINSGFELIPECIKYARLVYRNTRHVLQYFMSFQFTLLFSAIIPIISLGASAFSPAAIIFYALLTALPLAVSLSTENLRGNELKDTFGKENQGMNLQNLLIIPCITSFIASVVVTLTARLSLNLVSDLYQMRGGALLALVSGTVFLSFVISMDDVFDISVFKNKELIISAAISFALVLLFVLTPFFSSLILVKAPNVKIITLALITGLVPALICMGIKLVKKYIFAGSEKNV